MKPRLVALVAALLASACSQGETAAESASAVGAEAGADPSPSWAQCRVGATIDCSFAAASALPIHVDTSISVMTALGQLRGASPLASDLGDLALHPESFPITLTFTLNHPTPGMFHDLVWNVVVSGPSATPLEAKWPLPLWRVRILDPDQLGGSFAPTAPNETRSVAPYQVGVEPSAGQVLSFQLPSLNGGDDLVFIAPNEASIAGTVTIPAAEFTDPDTELPATLDGPGVYELRATGLHLVSRSFDAATDAGAGDAAH